MDINGDGIKDIVAASSDKTNYQSKLYWAPGTGGGALGAQQEILLNGVSGCQAYTGKALWGATFYDLNGDGLLDVTVAPVYPQNSVEGDVYVYYNTGSATSPAYNSAPVKLAVVGSWGLLEQSSIGFPITKTRVIEYEDINLDGRFDLCVIESNGYPTDGRLGSNARTRFYLNTGTNSSPQFEEASSFNNITYGYSYLYILQGTMGDLNGDGAVDVVECSDYTENMRVIVHYNSNADNKIKLTIDAYGAGTVSHAGVVLVDSLSSRTITFSPAQWYVIDSVVVDGANIGTPLDYTFSNLTSDHSLKVYFGEDPNKPSLCTLSIASQTGGSASLEGDHSIPHGSDSSVLFTPSSGMIVDSVIIDSVNYGPVTEASFLHLYDNHEVQAYFGTPYTGGYPQWNPTAAYANPTTVVYEGELWRNQWYSNPGDGPSESGTNWQKQPKDYDDTLVTVQLTYLDTHRGDDTIITVTTTTINGVPSVKTDTTTKLGGVTPVETKLSRQNRVKGAILANGALFNAPVAGSYTMTLYDVRGRVVQRQRVGVRKKGLVNLPRRSRLSRGIYLIRVEGCEVDIHARISIR